VRLGEQITRRFRNLIAQRGDLKDIALLGGSGLIAQAIGFVAQPVATRIYTPHDFGVLSLIVSLLSMFGPALNGQYNLSIVSSTTDEEAIAVTTLSLYVGLGVSVLLSVGLVVYNIVIPATFAEASFWIYAAIPLFFVTSISNVAQYYNNRFGYFKLLSVVSIYQATASNVLKLSLGVLGFGTSGLVVAQLSGVIVGIRKQSKYLIVNFKSILNVSKAELVRMLVKHKAQPLFSTPGLFVITYSTSVIPIIIGSLYGVTQAGYYSLGALTLVLPISILSNSVGSVFFRNASREHAETGGFRNSLRSTFILLASLASIPMLLMLFYAEPIFSLVFGSAWTRCGTFVRLLIPWYWTNIVVGSLVIGLIVSGKQIQKLLVQCLFVVEIFAVTYAAKMNNLPIESFLSSISIAYCATYLLLLALVFYYSGAGRSQKK
jgi:O-antigen/teichoic acid export membrane protein